MQDFYEVAKLCHEDRLKLEKEEKQDFSRKIRLEYANYSLWCRANNKLENEKTFNEYVKEEKPELNFWYKKAIFERYFNYTFEYIYQPNDSLNGKWKAKKNKAI